MMSISDIFNFDIKYVIKVCALLRGVDGLEHRTIAEFSGFLEEMERYLMYGEKSKYKSLREFQESLEAIKELLGSKFDIVFNADDIRTYVFLFLLYCMTRYGKDFKCRKEGVSNG